MNKNFEQLIRQFKKINKMKYVKGINNTLTNSCGLTLEYLLNKKPDSSYLPDYKGIEIKTTLRYSRYSINLFSLKFDGPSESETSYLLNTYGIRDYKFKDKKTLIVELKFNEKVFINSGYYLKLNKNDNTRTVFIDIYDLNMKYIETRGIINYDSIEERINIKLKNLALIYASKKIIDNFLHFRFYKIRCFTFSNFSNFISLLETGDVHATLMLRISRSGKNEGNYANKNMVFNIRKDSITKLFDEIYSYGD